MGKYKIEIQEFLARVVEIDAASSSEAFSKIHERYEKAEIVLDYNDFVQVDFIDINSQSKDGEKNKLTYELIAYVESEKIKHLGNFSKPRNNIHEKIERLKALLD